MLLGLDDFNRKLICFRWPIQKILVGPNPFETMLNRKSESGRQSWCPFVVPIRGARQQAFRLRTGDDSKSLFRGDQMIAVCKVSVVLFG